ncbi:MAG: HPr kinase/phosphorylase [Oscillospiraceae bacterium]|nr:HPr kinase/phosphorylase [Clostridia bacterium]MBQ9168180.1 HPr kinase/phosphorylase [Oscillospiraceae bacterium]
MIQAAGFAKALQLTELSPSTKTEWDIRSADLNRPGVQFCGFYEYFAFERPQVIGKVEMTYLESLEPAVRRERLQKYFSYDLPCVVICRGMTAPPELLEAAKARDIAVYQTSMLTTKFTFNAINYLNRCLAPRVTRHGVLVDVYGVGVLLTGESGVGKSEAALELVKRGHQLVADDVVDICRVSDNRLTGECPEMVRHFMEIRGIGIIDIKAMYGIGAVATSKSIDLVMHMEHWVQGKEYDRLGLSEETITILGVKVPHQIMPVRPGRNLAIIIEVAARNLSLKRMGYSAAHELDRRLNEMIMKKTGQID